MKIEDLKKVLEIVKFPVVYEPYAQMVFDSENHLVLSLRGWGRISKMNDPERIQDIVGDKG